MAASPDPKQLQEIKKLLDEIAKGYDTLRQKNPFAKFDTEGLQDVDQTINQLRDALDGVNARVEDFTESVSESYNAFKSIVSEIGKVNSGLNESKKSYSAAASLAQKIRDHELGISNLSSKQLKQVKAKLESSKQNLKSATALLQEERTRLVNGRRFNELSAEESQKYADLTKNIKDNIRNLSTSAETYGKLNSQIDSAITKEKQLEKQLGITGGVLKGIAKIPILGDLFDTTEALEEMEDTIRKGGSSTEALGAGFKNIGSQIKGQLLNPANLVLGAITQLISALQSTDKGAGEMAKTNEYDIF
jgi:chromosome segregation ATPase